MTTLKPRMLPVFSMALDSFPACGPNSLSPGENDSKYKLTTVEPYGKHVLPETDQWRNSSNARAPVSLLSELFSPRKYEMCVIIRQLHCIWIILVKDRREQYNKKV